MSSAAHDNHGAGHGSLGSYAIGFVLSVILTAIPFYMVVDGAVVVVCSAAHYRAPIR